MGKVLVAIGVLLVVGVGGFLLINNSSPEVAPLPTNNDTSTDDMVDTTDSSELSSLTNYVAYSPEVFEQTADSNRVLFFFANWCPTCIPVDEEINSRASEIPEDVSIIRVNYNDDDTDANERDLANKYDVTYQHTFVQIDSQGNAINTWNGGGLDKILSEIQ